MSYHDKQLTFHTSKVKARAKRLRWSVMRGINLISINPPSPNFTFGTLDDDVKAVGGDMRKAMKQIHAE